MRDLRMPRVSILMPLYRPKIEYVRQALACVRAQTFIDYEVILLNQPGGDAVRASIADFLDDPRYRFIQGDTLRTIGANWNACLPHARGEYIAYFFYDDLWEPLYVQSLVEVLDRHAEVGFVSAGHTYRIEGDVWTAPWYEEIEAFMRKDVMPGVHPGKELLLWWMERGLKPNVIGEPSFVLLRSSLIDRVGPFDEVMVQVLDGEYWTRCLAVADWYYEPAQLGSFRVHMAGASAQNEMQGRGIFERFDVMTRVMERLRGSDRRRAKRALRSVLAQMIERFFLRLFKRRKVSGQGSRGFKAFCLRHPLLIIGAVMELLRRPPRDVKVSAV